MPEGVNAKVEALFAQSLSAFAVVHLRITSLQRVFWLNESASYSSTSHSEYSRFECP
jgi:hypothetical protein